MTIKTIKLSKWEDIIGLQRPHAAFRGQSNTAWSLSTSLERACLMNDGDLLQSKRREELIIHSFKQNYHNYSTDCPEYDDDLRWLSIMQHHGAPTRLLDWTYSVLVAAYFSVEGATSDSAIWEVDTQWLVNSSNTFLKSKGIDEPSLGVQLGRVSREVAKERFKSHYISNTYQFVRIMTPYYRDKRLTAQQGVFVCPGDISISIMENFSQMIGNLDGIIKYIIPFNLKKEILYKLYTSNIGSFSLFPGIDGFSNTLKIYNPTIWGTDY